MRITDELACRIRKARRRKMLTQAELAAQLRISRSAVGNWESPSGVAPSSGRLIGIALATGVSYEWLATGRGYPDAVASSAPEAEWVDDPVERRLLHAFRGCRSAKRRLVLQLLDGVANPGSR